ncbi:hypothetical protein ACHAXT_006635 [Thalassiosira profunda]
MRISTRFVLVGTQHAENVGACARAIKTMGFADLTLVAPRDVKVLTRHKVIQRASGAKDVLQSATICSSLEEATGVLRFTFEDFIHRCCASAPREILADSAATDGDGSNWRLMLRRGVPPPGQDRVMINLVLVKEKCVQQPNDGTTKYSFIVRRSDGSIAYEEAFVSSGTADAGSGSGFVQMFQLDMIKVDDGILDVNGALTIDVNVQSVAKAESKSDASCNPFGKNMLELLRTGERADVAFIVGDTTFRAHRFILESNSPALARLCDGSNASLDNPVRIYGTSRHAFAHLLRYVYGGDAPEASVVQWLSRDLIAAAHRFGVTGLISEVERILVNSFTVDASNCIELVIFADKHDCSALKHAAISYLLARSKDLVCSRTFQQLRGHPDLMHEILLAMADAEAKANGAVVPKKRAIRGHWRSLKERKKKPKQQKPNALATLRQAKRGADRRKKPKPKTNSFDRIVRRAALGGFAKKRQVSSSSSLPPLRRRAISTIAESMCSLDAVMIRSHAKRILAAANSARSA